MSDETAHYRSCDMCGRTILRGERVRDYVTASGERAGVCALCLGRAEAAGWLPAELAGTAVRESASRGRAGVALRARLGKVADRAREAATSRRERGEEAAKPERKPRRPRRGAEEAQDEGPAQPKQAAQAARAGKATRATKAGRAKPARPKKAPPPRTPARVRQRAVERFNGSHEARKVAGLIRSLGEPSVAVHAKGGVALVTIAWELSWYQWEVDAGEAGTVREIAKGDEVAELGESLPDWNAAAEADGKLKLRK